jgi:uncharacterized membrane protein SpoIIM required for sporulation
MNLTDRFINDNKNDWQRLEDLLRLLDNATLRQLNREEVRELGHLYRRTASDLAIARAESRDPRLINYLNSLVVRAHGRIYRADAQGGNKIRVFFWRDFPQTFRRTWKFTALSFTIFMVFGLIGFIGTWRDGDFSEHAGVPPRFRSVIKSKIRWWEDLNEANQIGASEILTNNIMVTFYAFALGALLGLGTIYVLINNGLSIGAVLALTYREGFGHELVTFMAGHGVIELSCIFMAGGAGMMIGYGMLMPGNLSRADSLKKHGLEAVRLILGCVPLLVIAGCIEGFISPAMIHPSIKFGVATLTGILLYSYLLLAGREVEDANEVQVARVEAKSVS